MPEYLCKGTLTLSGVEFTIKADSLEDAKRKAEDGEFEDWDTTGAEGTDWEMRPATVRENK